jgi:hypothetical protein
MCGFGLKKVSSFQPELTALRHSGNLVAGIHYCAMNRQPAPEISNPGLAGMRLWMGVFKLAEQSIPKQGFCLLLNLTGFMRFNIVIIRQSPRRLAWNP